ncbi:MAG TPA: histidine kinase dimerization/phospho-acceptor domain-containing protein, partial [Patescibacteria group bacterium]|nr:histidine kinase dimerization/phospho-acceptor domain-containing protein [Patescibacteria group bacterium]
MKAKVVSTTFSRLRWRIIGLVAFANLFVFCLIAVSLQGSYQQYAERAAVTSRNTNHLVSQSIAGEIDHINLAMRTVVDEYSRQLGGGAKEPLHMDDFLSRLQSRLPMVDSLRITDADGNVVAGSGGVPPAISASDRDYFIHLRDNRAAGLAISQPMLGRISGKWVLIFARRLEFADGGFAGVVYAPVTIGWFERKFDELEVGPHGAVVMRGNASRDFDLLARYPAAGFVGQTKVSDTFRATIGANPHGGTYQARAGGDDVLRTFSFQAVGDYPLITLVGLAPEDYLGDWWRELEKLAALGAIFTLVTSLGGLAMLRTWKALEHRTEDLARSNADLEQFAYVASHDLQTPLRNIVSYTQLLAKRYGGQLDDDADEFIGYIVGGAKHMSQMITDLLSYARVSTTPRQAVAVELGPVVDGVLSRFRVAIENAGARVTVGELPAVLAEDLPMESLFQNLIENAVHYRDPDRPLHIEISAEPANDGFFLFTVRDNGIGI